MIKVKKLNEKAIIPSRQNIWDAGLDLHTVESLDLYPGKRALLSTGLAFELPLSTVGLIWPRSKLAKFGLDILAGVVDQPYRGEVMISVINHGDETIEIRAGDKIAQMLVQVVDLSTPFVTDELSDTERGSKGINCSELRRR